jgi:hypothetical protein
MNRCRECHAVMTKTETVCLGCGSQLEVSTKMDSVTGGFRSVINVLFIASAIMTVASLFFDATPPFSKCLVSTLVLLVVKSSAGQMVERKKT